MAEVKFEYVKECKFCDQPIAKAKHVPGWRAKDWPPDTWLHLEPHKDSPAGVYCGISRPSATPKEN